MIGSICCATFAQLILIFGELTSSAELGVGTSLVSGSLKVASPAKPASTAKIMNVPLLKKKQIYISLLQYLYADILQ